MFRFVALFCLSLWGLLAWAKPPLQLVVPYPAGGVSDAMARIISPALSQALQQPVAVLNQAGASGGVAARLFLQKSTTALFQGSPNELILAPRNQAALGYQLSDFKLVQLLSINPLVVLTRPDLPAQSIPEFMAYAQQRATQHHPLTYASVGNGSLYHLLGEKLSTALHLPMTHIPYPGGAPIAIDLRSGRLDFAILPLSQTYIQTVRMGHLKALATLSQHPLAELPNTPALHQTPGLQDFVVSIWSGYFVPAATPHPQVAQLHQALTQVIRDPEVRKTLQAHALTVPEPLALDALEHWLTQASQPFESLALLTPN